MNSLELYNRLYKIWGQLPDNVTDITCFSNFLGSEKYKMYYWKFFNKQMKQYLTHHNFYCPDIVYDELVIYYNWFDDVCKTLSPSSKQLFIKGYDYLNLHFNIDEINLDIMEIRSRPHPNFFEFIGKYDCYSREYFNRKLKFYFKVFDILDDNDKILILVEIVKLELKENIRSNFGELLLHSSNINFGQTVLIARSALKIFNICELEFFNKQLCRTCY